MVLTAISIAVLAALGTAAVCFRLLRNLTNPRVSSEELNSWIDINWHSCRPLERLLDPAEFEYLRRRGLGEKRIEELRAKRRELFRMYLRRLTCDFNAACCALSESLVNSTVDRPDLARNLGQQRMLFYRALVEVEIKLMLNAAGFDAAPSLELIRPLERMHQECCRLLPSMQAVAVQG